MSEQPVTPGEAAPSLAERLQDITEALAATRTRGQVFEIVLHPALGALGAIAGTVLLMNGAGDRLEVAATQGDAAEGKSFWPNGPLDDQIPTGDAVLRHQALFFEHPQALTAAYPQLEAHIGKVGVSATAVLPMFLDEQPLGVLTIDFKEPHDFTVEERRFLRTLAAQCAIALGRVRVAAELEQRTAALDAFVTFTRLSAATTDTLTLARQAVKVLRSVLGEVSVAYYQLEDELWKARVWSEDIAPEVAAVLTAGIALDAPSFAQAVQTREVVFVAGWDAEREGVAQTEGYGAVAFFPYFLGYQPRGLLVVGTQAGHDWTERERSVFQAVGSSLQLALERAEGLLAAAERSRDLERSNAELRSANEELDAFAYSASHDLRTPVRHIVGFNELLRKSLGDGLGSQSARYLGVIGEAAIRMNTLIDAMLDLSRTSRLPLRLRLLDLGSLVEATRSELEPEVTDRQVEWRVGSLPLVMGDQDTLHQVLSNLLSNALKYSRTREVAVIEVWAEERSQEWAVFVRDNGVGFDAKYQHKLFAVFQRLHRTEEFEGIGIGLANVRRIITRHGGEVSASSVLGEGATFSFTLPREG